MPITRDSFMILDERSQLLDVSGLLLRTHSYKPSCWSDHSRTPHGAMRMEIMGILPGNFGAYLGSCRTGSSVILGSDHL